MGRGRAPCCDKSKVNKGPWSPAEDLRLITFIRNHGHGNWRHLPKQAGLLRCGKSCRLRWINYLSPDVKRGNFSKDEEETIIKLHQSLGNKWSKIASHLPGRTDNEIKNVWNTHLKKRSILVRKDGNGHEDDQTKESSIIFSSQSCSSTTDEEQKDASSSSSISSYESNDSNSNQVDVTMPNQEPNSLLDFAGPGYHEIDNVAYEGNNQSVISGDQVMFEIPSEPDIDFWGMLDNLDPFQYSGDSLPLDFEASHHSNFRDVECDHGTETDQCSKWLKYLENELGLAEATSDGGHHHNHNLSKDAAGELGSETILGPENDPDCYFHSWPSSPHKFWDLIF